ncbi:MAG: hypothetical protein ABEJ66_02075 [Candidatus Nanohaloarchaea archaeon]
MAFMTSLMNGIASNPDVLIVGIAAGFIIAKFMSRRRRGMMGGGGMV